MKFSFARFNTFLCATLLLAAVAGCHTSSDDKDKEGKKVATVIELHMEADATDPGDTYLAPIGRDNPILLEVQKEVFMDGEYLDHADVVDEEGGQFSIRLKFNWQGASVLNMQTARNPGRRVAVFCAFGKGKEKHFFIASPKVVRPISNGVFTFAPAVTRDEADRIVRGLNAVAKQVKKDSPFNDKMFQ
jgi:preprotein translocase subunit SecD